MRAPAFWWKPAPGPIAHLLSPFGAIYGAAAARRMRGEGEKGRVPVICIGNFVAGGAGKTPTAIAFATALLGAGRRPFFVSRGYGAANPVTTPIIVDPGSHTAADVGDEPLLLARVAPAIVCADRVAGAHFAAASGADAIVMDDGLQNPALAKDFRVAVVDGATGIGNGLCIPAGPLRAPLDVQLAHTDALIVIGRGEAGARVAAHAAERGVPVSNAELTPAPEAAASLPGRRVVAFAGIGRPDKFFATLRQAGAEIAGEHAFADHHPYSARELAALRAEAARRGALLMTTEKDLMRIGPAPDIAALPVTLSPDEPELFGRLAQRALDAASVRA